MIYTYIKRGENEKMLQIKNIYKQYITGELRQIALNNVNLNLRDNEFVAVLGPSGSGKTTLLNIIGGLDRYDNGDLIIKFRVTDGENWKLPKNEEVYLTLRLGYGRPLISATLHNADLSKCTDMINPLPYSGDGTATQFDLEKTLNSKKPWFCE